MLRIAEQERRADDLEFRHGTVKHGGGAFRELDLGVLRLLEAFVLGTDLAAGIDLKVHRAGGKLAKAFRHVKHRLMDRVVGGEAVPETEHADAAGRFGGPGRERTNGGGDEACRQDVENPPGDGIRKRLAGLLEFRHGEKSCPFVI